MLSGETEQTWQVHHGLHALYFNKEDNEITVVSGTGGEPTYLTYPKIGKPYSSEFSKNVPRRSNVSWKKERSAFALLTAPAHSLKLR